MASLPKQHALDSLLDDQYLKKTKSHHLSICNLIFIQCQTIKSLIVDINNHLNKVFLFFDRLHKKLLPGFQLVDNFPDHFSFHIVNYKDTEVKNAYFYTFDKIFKDFLSNPNTILVISDASIKNNVATSILHIHSG